MKTDKSLEEVWNWKEEIYQETKDMSMEEKVRRIKENASKIDKEYKLDLKVVSKRNGR